VWLQRRIDLAPRARGFHVVTGELLAALPELGGVGVGLLHLLIAHTTASLTLSENVSPDVRADFVRWFDEAVPERGRWSHRLEGPDDMPSHVKAALLGPSLTLPVASGRLALGTWQGVYLCEHRNDGGPRTIVATLTGEAPGGR
jgi:secondary thiamine-phosphate synthase enzyme